MKRNVITVAILLSTAACSGETVPEASATASVPTGETATTTAPVPGTDSTLLPGTEPAPTSTAPHAQGLPPLDDGAAAAFDARYLDLGSGSGFPVLDDPALIPASEVWWLEGDDVVLGVVSDGQAQAYPVNQMAYHHLANITVAGEPFLVTY